MLYNDNFKELVFDSKVLLIKQLAFMESYTDILVQRLEND